MKIDVNDPRLTAFALGELDEREAVRVAAVVERSAVLRAEVDAIRAAAAQLAAELQAEAAPGLTEAQRALIEQRAAASAVAVPWLRRYRVALGVAASVVIVATAGVWTLPSLSSARFPTSASSVSDMKDHEGSVIDGVNTMLAGLDTAQSETTDQTGGGQFVFSPPADRGLRVARDQELKSVARRLAAAPGDGSVAVEEFASNQGFSRKESPWAPARSGGKIVVSPDSASGAVALIADAPGSDAPNLDLYHDFTKYENISYGYQVPFGPSDHRARDGSAILSGVPTDSKTSARVWNKFRDDGQETDSNGWGIPAHSGAQFDEYPSAESYAAIFENPFLSVNQQPLSTFSIDVDTASYANVRRMLTAGRLPPPDAVRIEEMINYFDYAYPQPVGDEPFSVNVEVAECPWNGEHLLARIGLNGYEFAPGERPPANLVFLIDVSGSMQPHNKLPLLQQALKLLVNELERDDRVAMVVYAGASGLVLPSTPATNRATIINALDNLSAGGSTNGGAGIQLAYDTAAAAYIPGGVNRVILATDGDFNVGVVSQGALVEMVAERAKEGVFLSVLGFGMGNLKDSMLESLADKGNGNYAYIDTLNEAQKVLVEQMGGTLVTIAKDVKIQIEFNPAEVAAYRLIGYENRLLAAQDFNDDRKDAGEIGAGHTVTALYELVPPGAEGEVLTVDPLKYQTPLEVSEGAETGELMTVKLRYKAPEGEVSELISVAVRDMGLTLEQSSDDFAFAAAVAAFGMLLRGSTHAGAADYGLVETLAAGALGDDAFGYRAEFLTLVQRARGLASGTP